MTEKHEEERLHSLGELDDLRQALNIAEQSIGRGLRVIEQIAEIIDARYHNECQEVEEAMRKATVAKEQ